MKSRVWWFLGLLLLAGVTAPFVVRAQRTHAAEVAWDNYQKDHPSLISDADAAPAVPDGDNFAAHPWVAKIGSKPKSEDGSIRLENWRRQMDIDHDAPEEGNSLFAGKPQEARNALDSAREYEADFRAIHEAAARPACRLPEPSAAYQAALPSDQEHPAWYRLSEVAQALAHRADAALAAGELDLAIADLEAMLRIGRHLRSQHVFFASVIGMGNERRALEIIAAGLAEDRWSTEGKRRLVAAMRTTPADNELSPVMRRERAEITGLLDKLGKAKKSERLEGTFWYPPARIVALNKLYVCKRLEPILVTDSTREDWVRFEAGLYSDPMTRNEAEGGIGLGFVRMSFSIIQDVFEQEDEFLRIRHELSK